MDEIILAALATYGLSSLIVFEDGLFKVFFRLREKYPNSAFNCTICLSVWLAVPFAVLAFFGLIWILAPFVIICVVTLLERL